MRYEIPELLMSITKWTAAGPGRNQREHKLLQTEKSSETDEHVLALSRPVFFLWCSAVSSVSVSAATRLAYEYDIHVS